MNALAIAWAEAQRGLDAATHAVLKAMAERANGVACALSQAEIAAAADVEAESVEWHIATLVNAGLLLIRDGRLELNLDIEMLSRHLQRNRRRAGPEAPIAAPETPPQPEPPRLKPQKPAPATPPTRVFVREGSPEWQAWMRARPRGCPVHFSAEHKARGWWFPSLWPGEQRGAA